MSASRDPNTRDPNIYDVETTPEAVLLPPPPRPQKSVLKSLEALDAAEKAGLNTRGPRKPDQASGPIIIDAKVEAPATPQAPRPEPAAAPREQRAAPGARPAEETIQPMRASVFRTQDEGATSRQFSRKVWPMRAAAAAVLVVAGWAGASMIFSDGFHLASQGNATAKLSPLEQMQRDMQAMAAEMSALRERLGRTDTTELQHRLAAENDALKKTIFDLSRRVDQLRSAQTASATELGARIERVRADDARGREEIAERLARLERQNSDTRTTASTSPAQNPHALPQIPTLPAPATGSSVMPRASGQPPAPGEVDRRASALSGFVLHEVQNGVALIEGRGGFIEAYPGATIPGAGRVQSIVRRGGAWVVVTSNGVIAQKFD